MGNEPGRLAALIAGAAAIAGGVLGFLLIAGQLVVFTNLFSPLIKEHCLKESASGALTVDSRWTLRVPWVAALDGDGCVRNSPLREGVAAAGLWELGTPEEQVEQNITSRLASQTQADYVRATLELRRAFDPEIRRITNALTQAPTPARARQLVGELIEVFQHPVAAHIDARFAKSEAITDHPRRVVPPIVRGRSVS